MNEVWNPVVGFENVYEVSDHGRVKRVRAGRGAVAGKILSMTRINKKGYPTVFLHKCENGIQTRKAFTTHLVVAAAFLPPKPSVEHQINHKDGVKTNNSPSNLEWVTNDENIAHSWANGLRHYIGENNHTSKLTESDVYEIIRLKGQVRQRDIAVRFNVGLSQIKAIHRGISWKHITNLPDVAESLRNVEFHTIGGPKGEKSSNAKLTNQQVREIKSLFGTHTTRELSNLYNISVDTICLIRRGKRWNSVKI